MAGKPWGGRFAGQTDRRVESFTESISFDRRLFQQDIRGSLAHARMLQRVGLLTADECRQIERGLLEIRAEIEAGQFAFVLEREDIHMHIEAALIEKVGDAGRKLHTARSRNDQVVTGLKLWTREAIDRVDAALVGLQRALVDAAGRHREVILPGYTHMQRAQPVLAPHYFLAYVGEARARPLAAGGLPQAAERAAAGRRGPGRDQPADRPRFRGPGTGLRRRGGQQPGRLQRPRLRGRVGLRADDDRRAPRRLGRGVDPLEHPGVRLPGLARRDLHGQQHHAAEEEPGRAGADPRPVGAGRRRPDDAPGADQGLAAGLQPRPAGRQGAAVRRLRHGRVVPGAGGRGGARARASASTGSPSGSTRASSTRPR